MTAAMLVAAWVVFLAAPAAAQGVDGYVSTMIDVLPDQDGIEWRSRIFVERTFDIDERIRVTASGFAEGLFADRGRSDTTACAIVRPHEAHLEVVWPHGDFRVGWSRVAWGRLDEFQPTDVINPLDLTRFFFEGRSEARMPVALVRARVMPTDRFTVEGIYVPFFRGARFDQLDEETSIFNVVRGIAIVDGDPAHRLGNAQGGIRTGITSGRVDWSVMAYRGFASLPVYEPRGFEVQESFPRFTMLGGDFETVMGAWGFRGEVAMKDDVVEGGLGFDRRAGGYRLSGNVLVTDTAGDTDTSFVTALDRAFGRDTRHVRAFAVYNPWDESAFARVIVAFNLRDDVMLETSGGVFVGDGTDALGRFDSRDFVYARLKVFF